MKTHPSVLLRVFNEVFKVIYYIHEYIHHFGNIRLPLTFFLHTVSSLSYKNNKRKSFKIMFYDICMTFVPSISILTDCNKSIVFFKTFV